MSGDSPSPPSDPFRIVGSLFERKYRVDRIVARGGFGVVYAGRHIDLDVPVAIKVLKPSGDIDPEAWSELLAQFLQEAKTLAKLRHPNVVAALDAGFAPIEGFDTDVPWMVLEWLEGETLRDALRARRGREGRTPAECMALLRPVLEAIADAHDAGIVHRDLKPSNIMLVPGRHGPDARVLDFGIAKMMKPELARDPSSGNTATESRTSSFTVASAAPEQLSGSRTGPWTDVYALALLVTEVLTDRAPMGAIDPNDHYRKVFDGARPTPRTLGVDCGAWEAVLQRALAVRPSDRQANARELLADLERTLPNARMEQVEGPQESIVDGGYSATDRRAAKDLGREASTKRVPVDEPRHLSTSAGGIGAFARSRVGRAAIVIGALACTAGVALFATRSRPTGSSPPFASMSGSASTNPTGCSGNRACVDAHAGEPWVCRMSDHTCVAIASDDCTARFEPEDVASDDTVWLGAVLPLTGPRGDAYGKQAANVLELARHDFANVGGIPAADEGRLRRLGLVLCDGSTNPRGAANHLAELDLPVVLGPAATLKDTIDLSTNVFVPKRMLVLDLFDESPLVTRIPQPADVPRLVWRLTSSADGDGEALAHLVSDYGEPLLRGANGPLANGRPMKLAIVRSDAATPTSILDSFATTLLMNGKPLVENNGAFQQHTFHRAGASASDKRAIVASLVAFAPHVIAYADSEIFEDLFLDAIERDWKAAYRPLYVSEGALANPKLRAFIGTSAERRARFLSIELPANTDENFKFVLHYNEMFDPKITPGTAPGVIFDAFYVAAYAAAAVRKQRITGADMAEAMRRLGGDGERVGVGPSQIFAAYAVLKQGKVLHLVGAGTQLDFDYAAGEIPSDFAVYCFGVDRTGRASEPVESGLRFDHRSKRLVGTMRCP